MKTLLEQMVRLKPGTRIAEARCPKCDQGQEWWVPGDPELMKDNGYQDNLGLTCGIVGCGFVLNFQPVLLGPPDILCSRCGQALDRVHDGFHCMPCGRTVTP